MRENVRDVQRNFAASRWTSTPTWSRQARVLTRKRLSASVAQKSFATQALWEEANGIHDTTFQPRRARRREERLASTARCLALRAEPRRAQMNLTATSSPPAFPRKSGRGVSARFGLGVSVGIDPTVPLAVVRAVGWLRAALSLRTVSVCFGRLARCLLPLTFSERQSRDSRIPGEAVVLCFAWRSHCAFLVSGSSYPTFCADLGCSACAMSGFAPLACVRPECSSLSL